MTGIVSNILKQEKKKKKKRIPKRSEASGRQRARSTAAVSTVDAKALTRATAQPANSAPLNKNKNKSKQKSFNKCFKRGSNSIFKKRKQAVRSCTRPLHLGRGERWGEVMPLAWNAKDTGSEQRGLVSLSLSLSLTPSLRESPWVRSVPTRPSPAIWDNRKPLRRCWMALHPSSPQYLWQSRLQL